MRSKAALLAVLLWWPVAALAPPGADAHEPRNTLTLPGDARYRATDHPDRVILVVGEDPARTQSVNWRTGPGVAEAVAQIVVARDTPGLHLSATTVQGTTRPLVTANGLAHHHAVRFEGLEPDTLYAYRVRGHDTWSEWLQFRTAPASFRPFSFLYFGDAQNSVRSHFSRVIRESFRELPKASLLLHAGDLVNLREGNHDDEWGEWFEAGGFLHGMIPAVPVAGNHEHVKRVEPDGSETYSLSPHWPLQLGLPRNGPPGHEDTVYFVRYPGALFVVLDSTRALDEPGSAEVQGRWLDALLSHEKAPWVIVSHHHPVFSVAMGRGNPPLREHWLPVYERHGVDLVLQGHDHAYGRGHNVAEGATAVGARGVPVYVVSVAGPKQYLVSDEAREALERTGEDVQLYQVVHVEQDRLRYESRTVTGRIYDAFDVERTRSGSKRFVSRLPRGAPEDRCSNPSLPRPTRCWEGTELVD
ncbi:MAG: metallophosphoesterase family protein [Steroidobacteraceae bacterium]|nr:metallophosphoesterase family protein [Steroidobacteraceae bacterium]